MEIAQIGQLVRAKLGNFYFGGIVVMRTETKNWLSGEEKYTYTIKLPCAIYVETEEIF